MYCDKQGIDSTVGNILIIKAIQKNSSGLEFTQGLRDKRMTLKHSSMGTHC